MQTTAISLLERLRLQPDNASWQRLDMLYRPLILNWLRREPALRSEADDLVQEVMTALVRELPQFERQRIGSFRKWLRTVTIHRLQGYWRTRKKQAGEASPSFLSDLEDPTSALSQRWDDEHDQHVMKKLLSMLEGDYEPATWKAFQLVVFEERKPVDVADEMGISVNAVLLAKSRILKRLREEAEGLID